MNDWVGLIDKKVVFVLLGHEIMDWTNAKEASIDEQIHEFNMLSLVHI